jgi:peptide/nickel transport system substrate-binding protein
MMMTTRVQQRAALLAKLIPLVALLSLGLAVGQTYVFQRLFDAETLDPLNYDSPWGQSVIENVYETLYGYEGATILFRPALATGHELSDDGRTHTFRLREGVKFHSGNGFSCKDVDYSLKRALIVDPGFVGQSLIGTATDALTELGEAGTDAAYADYWKRISGSVECLGEYTVAIHSLVPDPILFAGLMSPQFAIVDSALVIANGGWDGTQATWRDSIGSDLSEGYLQNHDGGTGAFRVVSWEPGVRLVAERNPEYWGARPQIQTIVYEVVPDEDARIEALLSGAADQIDVRFTPLSDLEGKPGVKVLDPARDPTLPSGVRVVGAIFLNQQMGGEENPFIGSGELDGSGVPRDFFSDVDVRKCFAYSWDTGEDDPQYAGDGTFYPNMILLPSFSAYDPGIPHYKFDLKKAEEHCRAAWGGRLWENGMRLAVPADDWVGATYKATLEAMNPKFTIELKEITPEQADRVWAEMQMPWATPAGSATFPDAYAFMADWYQSSTSISARFGYANEEIDRLIAQARTEFDSAKRDDLYRQVGRLAYEDAPFVLLPSFPYALVVSDKVSGAYRNPMFSEVRWADLVKAE